MSTSDAVFRHGYKPDDIIHYVVRHFLDVAPYHLALFERTALLWWIREHSGPARAKALEAQWESIIGPDAKDLPPVPGGKPFKILMAAIHRLHNSEDCALRVVHCEACGELLTPPGAQQCSLCGQDVAGA